MKLSASQFSIIATAGGFYGNMGISSVLDCLYVDGMSLRNYLKEQYFYKTTGNPAQDTESLSL